MNLEEIQNYKSGFVFRHKLTNKIFTKFTLKTVITNYEQRIANPYSRSRVTKEIEKFYLGDVIRSQKVGFIHSDVLKPAFFVEKFTSLLEPLPNSVLRTGDDGKERSHNSTCEFAQDDCSCWCKGKYHGIGL